MKLVSVDPGLDRLAVAIWSLDRPAVTPASLLGIRVCDTSPRLSLEERLRQLGAWFRVLLEQEGEVVVVVELPAPHAVYGRHQEPAVLKAVFASMLASSLGTGCIAGTTLSAGAALLLQPADTTRKRDKAAVAAAFLRGHPCERPPAPRRGGRSADELDAVYVGLRHYQRARSRVALPTPG